MKKFVKIWTKKRSEELTKKEWLVFDKKLLHRLDDPAVEYVDGTKRWYVDNKLHRLDGPAIEHANGSKYWYVDGKEHRLDGPAIEYASETKYWYVDGKRHRLDGPAVECSDKSKHWYVNDEELDSIEVETWIEENSIDLTTESGQVAFKLRWT